MIPSVNARMRGKGMQGRHCDYVKTVIAMHALYNNLRAAKQRAQEICKQLGLPCGLDSFALAEMKVQDIWALSGQSQAQIIALEEKYGL